MPEKFPTPESEIRKDWERYQEKNDEYEKALDDIAAILDKGGESVKQMIREKWVPAAKELKDEAYQLRSEFIRKWGRDRQKELSAQELEKIQKLKGEAEEEWAETLDRRLGIEIEFDLTPKFDLEKLRSEVLEKLKEEPEENK